jgi:molybdopterin synthase sulfur carrier subunit
VSVTLVYLARLREALGHAHEEVELPPAVADVAALTAWLRLRGEPWQRELATGRAFRVAVNQRMAAPATAVSDGDEVAFFPPVTGG